MTDTPNKTLIIRFSSVGDIVLSSLLVRTFRTRFPNCQLDYVVKEEFADLVRRNPNVSNVLLLPRGGSFGDLQQLRRTIRRNNYDLVVDIHDNLRSLVLSWGSQRVVRINKRKFARLMLVNCKVDLYRKLGGSPSVALRYLETVSHCGVEDDGRGLEIFYSDDDARRVEQLLESENVGDSREFLGICPSAKHNTKMWPRERFAQAAAILSEEKNRAIILFGSQDEQARCEQVRSEILATNPTARVVNLAGRISLVETAAAMDRCALVLTNDSGLMHIAAARKRPLIAIFGSTVKQLGFFPFGTESRVVENVGLACRPCTHIGRSECPRGHFRCMLDVPVAEVVRAAQSLHTA
ncbi:MAG: lipopolysaccharide heptosyltransferase II [Ignavibacteriae bacterium]|nr:lipopolysaccharide heptosyltransferase II [Ignavibacteriota bacterium]